MAAKSGRKNAVRRARRSERRKRPAPGRRGTKRTGGKIRPNLLPFMLSICLLFCLAVIGYLSFQSVTASEFFAIGTIEVRGTERASKENIERIVIGQTERSGVWNADLLEIKARVEKLAFVRSAAVSRILPNGITVEVFEHEPKAIVNLPGGKFLVDGNGRVLAKAEKPEPDLPFELTGWNEEKSEAADKENVARVKLYQQMLTEWTEYGIADRVITVNIADIRRPHVTIEDSGLPVTIDVGREKFGENLSRGMKAIVGKGDVFEGVDLKGTNMILAPRRPSGQASGAN